MTDITDQESRQLREDAKAVINKTAMRSSAAVSIARYILANVEAPAPTLAEELIRMANEAQDEMRYADEKDLSDLAHRAEQIEQENEEQRGWNLSINEQARVLARERDEAREALAVEGRRVEKIAAERDEASAEVARLTAEAAELNAATVASGENVAADQQANMQGILAGSFPNPADVKPGEAWLVECRGERRAAVKDNDDNNVPWNTVNAGGWLLPEDNEDITLVSRLVPAPRVITNPDELDRLAEGTVIVSASKIARVRQGWFWPGTNGEHRVISAGVGLPATVLWEPEA